MNKIQKIKLIRNTNKVNFMNELNDIIEEYQGLSMEVNIQYSVITHGKEPMYTALVTGHRHIVFP